MKGFFLRIVQVQASREGFLHLKLHVNRRKFCKPLSYFLNSLKYDILFLFIPLPSFFQAPDYVLIFIRNLRKHNRMRECNRAGFMLLVAVAYLKKPLDMHLLFLVLKLCFTIDYFYEIILLVIKHRKVLPGKAPCCHQPLIVKQPQDFWRCNLKPVSWIHNISKACRHLNIVYHQVFIEYWHRAREIMHFLNNLCIYPECTIGNLVLLACSFAHNFPSCPLACPFALPNHLPISLERVILPFVAASFCNIFFKLIILAYILDFPLLKSGHLWRYYFSAIG